MKFTKQENGHKFDLLSKLTFEIDDALKLLQHSSQIVEIENDTLETGSPASLLNQCLALCEEHTISKPKKIRTLHHLACTGGTLLSKCVASMPNTQLLSEVDPLSELNNPSDEPRFNPTDIVSLIRQSTRGTSVEQIIELFLSNIEIIYSRAQKLGLRIILRDHAHSQFCTGADVSRRPSLLEILNENFPVSPLVTVRDPIDSYLSLINNNWVHFSPSTFDEYCSRYATFIRNFEGVPIVRYEDFVKNPTAEMQNICNYLDLPYNPDFLELFSAHKVSGDSGRSGVTIRARSRRQIGESDLRAMEASSKYQNVMSQLGY